MDEFLDHLFSSSSWSDVNATERPSWVGSDPSETNGILPSSIGVYEGDRTSSPMSVISSNHIMESLTTQSSSILLGGDSKYGLHRDLLTGETQPQQEGPTRESKSSLNEVVNGSSKAGYFGSSKAVGNNDSEPSEFQPSFRDSQTRPSIPQLWLPPSYGGVSSLPPIMGQDKPPCFGLQGEYKGQDELHDHPLPSFADGHQTTLTRTAGLPSHLQLSQLCEGNPIKHHISQAPVYKLQHAPDNAGSGCSGTVKPRGSSGLLSLSTGQGADLSESPDIIFFEKEVMKLMESNMTEAMQYLQSKGLCLMPIALAAAISSENASSGPVYGERKKPGFSNGLAPQNNGSPSIRTRQMSSNSKVVTENTNGNHNEEGITTSSYNGAIDKQEGGEEHLMHCKKIETQGIAEVISQ
ncbi:hypothetical protein HHK36_025359 [Tetracentron sinense]|uniref:Uncharacterized protein n=1 Tax=Tetracentron sinense TaxID=13715 RepID=A0A834YGN9_TETSI|nr:hypothetical protein HHK36_025359 [Tetracentron sinense]